MERVSGPSPAVREIWVRGLPKDRIKEAPGLLQVSTSAFVVLRASREQSTGLPPANMVFHLFGLRALEVSSLRCGGDLASLLTVLQVWLYGRVRLKSIDVASLRLLTPRPAHQKPPLPSDGRSRSSTSGADPSRNPSRAVTDKSRGQRYEPGRGMRCVVVQCR